MNNILELISERKLILHQLDSLFYGSIEIRNGYIYVHHRDNGVSSTKYVGKYTQELYEVVTRDNEHAKELKKKLKEINKKLSRLNYVPNEVVDDKVIKNTQFIENNLSDIIYSQSILEGIKVTPKEVDDVLKGNKITNLTAVDVIKINNLKRAWNFITSIEIVNYLTNYYVLSQINQLVEDGLFISAGNIRRLKVKIRESTYKPPMPYEEEVKQDIYDMLIESEGIDLAINLLLYAMKKQVFTDGNKRTAVIFANHYLNSYGLGYIVVPASLVDEFKSLLVSYYEDEKKKEAIASFLKDKCWFKLN